MKIKTLLYGLVGLAFLWSVPPAAAQESGPDVWARSCGSCHRAQPPNKYDADSWRAISGHMGLYARLTADEEAAVREFLMGAARPLAAEETRGAGEPVKLASSDAAFVLVGDPPEGSQVYARNCQACHGKEGKGDGPAAVALTPRPTNLADAKLIGKLSDDELMDILRNGKGTMPGFGKRLTDEELQALVSYVRGFSSGSGKEGS
jgi:mono/diheme cytochrome c family protein